MDEIYNTDILNRQVDEANNSHGNLYMMVGLKKSGYLEVKQPSNIKGRKLKTWKRKWVVVHKMTDLATGTFAAKFFLYNDEESTNHATSEKQAFIFDHVTSVEHAKSKTHPLAFQIVQEAPILVLSGLSEEETRDWIISLRELFWPDENKPNEDTFRVTIEQNEDAKLLSLSGDYWLSVSPEIISIKSFEDSSIQEWNLNFIKRFFMDKHDVNILVIETGSISEFGEAHFRFKTTSVPEILTVIKQNIQAAIKLRNNRTRSSNSFTVVQGNSSPTAIDQSFQTLLDRSNETQNNSVISVSPVGDQVKRSRNTSENSYSSVDEYNSLETSIFREKETQIVSTVTLSNDNGEDIELKIDQHGYSHVQSVENLEECNRQQNENKGRSASDCVTNDEYKRSTSVCSCDSGIANTDTNNEQTTKRKHKSNNSFDSGVHVSSTSSLKTEISASIGGIFIMTDQNCQLSPTNSACSFVPYSKVLEGSTLTENSKPIDSNIADNSNYSSIYWDAEVTAKNETNDVEKKENLYEDLDKYRKDLSKHLGFDPKINPTEVPPSLPDRPSTLPTRRKAQSKNTKRKEKKSTIQEMFKTVTRGRTGSVSSTSSSTSEVDDEKTATMIGSRQQWPLAKSAVSGNNELYTSVPDEGIFSSGRPRARSYEDRPNKRTLNDSILSVRKWPMDANSNPRLNTTILYDPIYSQVYKNRQNDNGSNTIDSGMCRSLKRSNSSVDLKSHEKSRTQQRDIDLLTGDDVVITKHSEILTPVLVSPQELDFIDFSTEIKVPELNNSSFNVCENNSPENSDKVWNPFPKIAHFTNMMKQDANEHEDLLSDPFDIFRIGFVSSSFGLETNNSGLSFDSFTELTDLDKTIYDPSEDIYMDMGNCTLQQEQTVEYVLPTEVSRKQ